MLRFNRWLGIVGFVATSACAGTDAGTPEAGDLSLAVDQAAVVSVPLTSVYQGAQLSDAFSSVVSVWTDHACDPATPSATTRMPRCTTKPP